MCESILTVRSGNGSSEDGFELIGDILSDETNPGRKKSFEIRKVMKAAIDQDHAPLERWAGMRAAETAVVWDAHLGGYPVCLIGIESRPMPRVRICPRRRTRSVDFGDPLPAVLQENRSRHQRGQQQSTGRGPGQPVGI